MATTEIAISDAALDVLANGGDATKAITKALIEKGGAEMEALRLAGIVDRIAEILWPGGNADAEHDSDTLGEVARIMAPCRPSGAAQYVVAETDEDPDGPADLADGTHEFAVVADASGPVRNAAIDALQANPDAVAVEVKGGKVVALVGPNGSEVAL